MTEYTAATSNATNKVTATPTDENADVSVFVGETEIENGTSASWATGANVLTVKVALDGVENTYTVTVTKS